MGLRLFLSSLGSADARRGAARALLAVCAAGYVLTLMLMAAAGAGLSRWFFVLLVWALMVYVPLRIGLEAMQSIAPAMRARLVAQAGGRADRYGTRASIELLVDGLFADAVIMPRIATPTQSSKAREGAVAILLRDAGGIPIAVGRCLATVEQWMTDITDWSAHHAPANIQARWADLRALTGLIAATKVLVAAHGDRLGRSFDAGALDGDAADVYLDTCLDSCDRLALEFDVAPWDAGPLALDVDRARRNTLRDAWKAFHDVPSPAVAQRQAFVDAVLMES
jgi:hypothetical protein